MAKTMEDLRMEMEADSRAARGGENRRNGSNAGSLDGSEDWDFDDDAEVLRMRTPVNREGASTPPMVTPSRVTPMSSPTRPVPSFKVDADVVPNDAELAYAGEESDVIASSKTHRKLARLFDLPEEEALVTEYMCALHSKILLQGKMYVYENYVCFYSNVFGYIKKRKIPFKDITLINRAKTAMVFPNAIEITYEGRTDFFTSFIFPDKSFRTICEQWSKVSHYGKLFAVNSAKKHKRKHQKRKEPENELEKNFDSSPNGVDDARAMSDEAEEEIEEDVVVDAAEVGEDAEEEEEDEEEDGSVPVNYGNIPNARVAGSPPSSSATLIKLHDAEMHCSVEELFLILWSDLSRKRMQLKLSEALEYKDVKITDWFYKKSIGVVREMAFTAPVRQTFGPKSTRCHQTQGYAVYDDGTFVLNTSQVQTDIPYGDYFKVEARWTVEPISKKKCKLSVGTEVIFTKQTMMKGLILSSVVDESKTIVRKTVKMVQNKLNPPKRVAKKEDSTKNEVIHYTNLKIPESSRDIVARMLTPLTNFVQSSDKDEDLISATPLRKMCIRCTKGFKIMAVILMIFLIHTMLTFSAQFIFGGLWRHMFGAAPVDDVTFWEARSKLLDNELVIIERRLAYLVKEIEVTKAAIAKSRG